MQKIRVRKIKYGNGCTIEKRYSANVFIDEDAENRILANAVNRLQHPEEEKLRQRIKGLKRNFRQRALSEPLSYFATFTSEKLETDPKRFLEIVSKYLRKTNTFASILEVFYEREAFHIHAILSDDIVDEKIESDKENDIAIYCKEITFRYQKYEHPKEYEVYDMCPISKLPEELKRIAQQMCVEYVLKNIEQTKTALESLGYENFSLYRANTKRVKTKYTEEIIFLDENFNEIKSKSLKDRNDFIRSLVFTAVKKVHKKRCKSSKIGRCFYKGNVQKREKCSPSIFQLLRNIISHRLTAWRKRMGYQIRAYPKVFDG